MSFMSPWLLMGTLGIALPIIAHIINKNKYKDTDWAAIQFLNRALRVRSRQTKNTRPLLIVALWRGIVAVIAMTACLSTVSAVAPTERMFGQTGIYSTLNKLSIRVSRVEGPVKGKIMPGTVIVGSGSSNFNNYLNTIRDGCIRSNIDYEMVETSRPLDAVLREILINRETTLNDISAGARL